MNGVRPRRHARVGYFGLGGPGVSGCQGGRSPCSLAQLFPLFFSDSSSRFSRLPRRLPPKTTAGPRRSPCSTTGSPRWRFPPTGLSSPSRSPCRSWRARSPSTGPRSTWSRRPGATRSRTPAVRTPPPPLLLPGRPHPRFPPAGFGQTAGLGPAARRGRGLPAHPRGERRAVLPLFAGRPERRLRDERSGNRGGEDPEEGEAGR